MARTAARKKEPASSNAGRASRPADRVLQIGDRLADETGEWEVIGRPYTTNAGKDVHVRVKKVGQPEVIEIRTWGAHERIAVRRG